MALDDADLHSVMLGWKLLPEAIRAAISKLVRANVPNLSDETALADERNRVREKLAMRLARDCRHIIQGCLREEEWQDADQEFFDVILPHL